MDYEEDVCKESAWQATLPSLLHNLSAKWMEASDISFRSCQRPSRKLTTEALCVLCVIFIFLMLCVIGSSISAYESCHKAFLRKKSSQKLKGQKHDANGETPSERKRKSTESSINSENLQNHFRSLIEMPIVQWSANANFALDAFSILSGFLTGYFFSKHYEKNNGKIPWVSFYALRILRITPVYMAVLGFYSTLFTYISSSPIWPTYNTNPACGEAWIWNLLYLNNYKSHWNQCMSMGWFLAYLMQLHVISPLFLVPLNKSPRVGYVLSAFAICFSCFLSFRVTTKYNLFGSIPHGVTIGLEDVIKRIWLLVDVLHQNTFARLTPYIIGILLGCHLHNRKLTKKSNWLTLIFGWILSVFLICTAALAFNGREESLWESAVYNSLKHLAFSCGFSWLIFVCVTKQAGLMEKFLSHRIFKPISHLSFSGYLIQAIIFEGYFLTFEVYVNESFIYQGILSDLSWVLHFIRLLIWTLVLAFVVSLIFESPVIRFINIFFIPNKNKSM